MLKKCIITLPTFFESEAAVINQMLKADAGLRLHIRKPEASALLVEELVGQTDRQVRRQISIHGHHSLALKYDLGGIHLSGRHIAQPDWQNMLNGFEGKTISASCHTFSEVEAVKPHVSYCFLSPIFNSISKQGYSAAFSDREIRQAAKDGIINGKVYALGGITDEKMPLIEEYGFGGFAMLGNAWKEYLHKI